MGGLHRQKYKDMKRHSLNTNGLVMVYENGIKIYALFCFVPR